MSGNPQPFCGAERMPDMKPALIAATAKAAGLNVSLPTCDVAGRAIASGTDVKTQAVKDPKTGQPQSNPARQVWIGETALSTALNTSFFAASVALFAVVMGAALLLAGIGFIVLSTGVMGGAGSRRRAAAGLAPKSPAAAT